MATKEFPLVPLFEKFIKDSYSGKRLKPDGTRIKPQTIENYGYVLRYLIRYEQYIETKLRIKNVSANNKRQLILESKYWRNFYFNFTSFLYKEIGCFDNYVGTVIKIIKAFFKYLNNDLYITAGEFYKKFYACKEEIPVITLLPQQLKFLILDKQFEESLSKPLQKTKDIFVFGCTVALRYSDLFSIKFSDIEQVGNDYYLPVNTIKTNTRIQIKIPAYCLEIIEKFRLKACNRKAIFPPIPPSRFNSHVKIIARQAGWISPVAKRRTKRGIFSEQLFYPTHSQYRFCDMLCAHTMRRTAITTMLMLGMKENMVRKISGHSSNSKSFYRYVNLAQSYVDNEMDLFFTKLVNE